jgi:ABC-type bacteriocin/lantibiotic exporter with double-glycine peptidase domain
MTAGTQDLKAVNSSCPVRGLFLLGILAILSAGCGAKSFEAVRPRIEARGHYIDGVPFVKQSGNDCGPAALAGVLAYYGRPADLAAITTAIYLPKLRGTLPMDLEQYARTAGFQTRSSGSTMDDLKAAIGRNNPVICLLDLGFGPYRQPHYVTVTGFDDGNKIVIMHDGATANRTMTYETFGKYWSRAGNWMIVITPQPGP